MNEPYALWLFSESPAAFLHDQYPDHPLEIEGAMFRPSAGADAPVICDWMVDQNRPEEVLAVRFRLAASAIPALASILGRLPYLIHPFPGEFLLRLSNRLIPVDAVVVGEQRGGPVLLSADGIPAVALSTAGFVASAALSHRLLFCLEGFLLGDNKFSIQFIVN